MLAAIMLLLQLPYWFQNGALLWIINIR